MAVAAGGGGRALHASDVRAGERGERLARAASGLRARPDQKP